MEFAAPARLAGRVESATPGGGAEALVALVALVAVVDHTGTVTASTLTDAERRSGFDDLTEGSYTLTAAGYPPVTSVTASCWGRTPKPC